MKNGLMVVSTGVDNKINIGDYIQALAAKQFLPSVDVMLPVGGINLVHT